MNLWKEIPAGDNPPKLLNMIIEVFKTVPIGMKEAVLSVGATDCELESINMFCCS